eukprot:768689-Hanusia_phi.AAC.11
MEVESGNTDRNQKIQTAQRRKQGEFATSDELLIGKRGTRVHLLVAELATGTPGPACCAVEATRH